MISSQITLDISSVKKININVASFDELKKHPYMNEKAAIAIVTHRLRKGNFINVDEIKELNWVNDSVFAKLAPYLTIQ